MDATSAALAVVGISITVDVDDRLEVPMLSDEVAGVLDVEYVEAMAATLEDAESDADVAATVLEVAAALEDETGVVPVVAAFNGQESSRSINDLKARVPTVLRISRSALRNQEPERGLMKHARNRSRRLREYLA